MVRTTLARTCCVSAPRRVRLPPQIFRATTAGRIACSARQFVASMPGTHRKANTAGNSVARCLAKRWAASLANPYAERLIGSLRRECLDHVIVLDERHLRRLLTAYLIYYHGARTHLALEKDAPTPRRVQVPTEGRVVAFPEVGGLHHRYERRAA